MLVSQTVTQQDLHVHNLTRLVELVEAEGLRKQLLLICGGSRISDELAKELGFDAGFSKGTYPNHLASYIVRELAERMAAAARRLASDAALRGRRRRQTAGCRRAGQEQRQDGRADDDPGRAGGERTCGRRDLDRQRRRGPRRARCAHREAGDPPGGRQPGGDDGPAAAPRRRRRGDRAAYALPHAARPRG